LIRLKACVILHQGIIQPPQENVTTAYPKIEFSDTLLGVLETTRKNELDLL